MSFRQTARRAMHVALTLSAVATFSTPSAAQSDSAMKKNTKDAMAKDAMAKDAMAKDGMAKDGMAKDGMMKDGMMKDGMMKEGMAKDGMMKDAMKAPVRHSLNLDKSGVALHGYDPVAYFVAGKPAKGKAAFAATYEGATYRFASAANRHTFTANPDKFAPQFGGYCAMGVALNKKLDVDPAAWRVVDGKLYLNVNRNVQRDWQKDIAGNIAKAETNWPAIRGLAPGDL